ncbi:MAG: THUMP domain-containing protein [Acidimicrobiia bacterium]|nr:THUMP domain-containing protein [Acidimicrobiia bacterium]
MANTNRPESIRVLASSEIYIKSRRTRQRFMPILQTNLEKALGAAAPDAVLRRHGNQEFDVAAGDLNAAAEAAATVFGVDRIDRIRTIRVAGLDDLATAVRDLAQGAVQGRTFAVRVRRAGNHSWKSKDAEVAIGNALFADSAGVDLSDPEVTVRVRIEGTRAAVVSDSWAGPGGLPIGTQAGCLLMLSGGIDSPVAGWMMLRRGCPLDMLHFQLECNQADHALAVGHELAARWGHGAAVNLHVINFEPIKKELSAAVHPRLRQVLLKQLMTEAAHRVAQQLRLPLIVNGDSMGQVSSQTAANLIEIDRYAQAPLLRPLLALTKQEIVDRARAIGTYELSTRAREVCDLSEGRPVETAAPSYRLRQGMNQLREGLIEDALATWESVPAADWVPGLPLTPVPQQA